MLHKMVTSPCTRPLSARYLVQIPRPSLDLTKSEVQKTLEILAKSLHLQVFSCIGAPFLCNDRVDTLPAHLSNSLAEESLFVPLALAAYRLEYPAGGPTAGGRVEAWKHWGNPDRFGRASFRPHPRFEESLWPVTRGSFGIGVIDG